MYFSQVCYNNKISSKPPSSPLTHEFEDILVRFMRQMVVHLGILPVVLPQLEYAQLVDSHVTYLPTLTTEEGLLGFLPWKPPVLTQVHVRQLLVEVEVAAPVLGERNVRSWGLF